MHVWKWKDCVEPGDYFKVIRRTLDLEKPTISSKIHTHEGFAEIFWIEEGRGTHIINSRTEPLGQGDVLFIRMEDSHGLRGAPGIPLQFVNVMFPIELLRNLVAHYFQDSRRWFWQTGPTPFQIKASKDQIKRLTFFAEELSHSPQERFYIDRFLLNIFFLLGDHDHTELPPDMPAWLAKACAAMLTEENLRQGLTTFYKLCSCSPEHASRQLKMHLGKTATEFINDLRCRRAARHLDMTSLSIQEIAHDCGYGSLSHFYHSFNQRYHVSPKKYRRLQHSSTIS